MRVVGNLRVPTGQSNDILLQAKGITGIESTQIRWFSRWSGGGEASPVEHSSAEAKSLKLEAKGLSGCHPSEQQLRQPDGKARGRIKDFSHNNLQKNTELKAALTGSTVRQKAKKENCLLYATILKLQKGMVSGLMKSVMSENQNSQSHVHTTTSRYLRFKPGNRGLNSPFTCPAGGGGQFSHIT
jgi:hypothetical protein